MSKEVIKKPRQGNHLPRLPEEILEEILKRLPVQSLVRCACTCKQWRSLIFCDSKFNKVHFDYAKRPSWKIPVVRSSSSIQRTIDCDCNLATTRPKETLTSYIRGPNLLGSYKGLLFVVGYGLSDDGSKEHALWNPYTNSIKRIDGQIEGGSSYSMSGLSYDCASDDYKAIVVLNDSGKRSPYMFSLRRNSCKKLSDLTVDMTGSTHVPYGITLDNGICHWEIKLEDREFFSIICFDPVVEKFKEVPLPDNVCSPTGQPLGIGALDGCLSLIHKNSVWVMKEHESWTKLYVLRPHLICAYKLVGYNSSKDEVVVIASGKDFQRFRMADVKTGAVRIPSDNLVRSFVDAFNVVPYTESLLCPW